MDSTFPVPCADGYHFPIFSEPVYPSVLALRDNCHHMDKQQIPSDGTYVSDAVGDDYTKWSSKTPVLLDAPTGSGKSTFICQTLIRHAAEEGSNLLLVSNRAALVRQQKLKVAEVISEYDSSISPNPDDNELGEYAIWGNTCICTYHSLFSLLRRAEYEPRYADFLQKLRYAVFDEVHFLYADAGFAASCGKLLQQIPALFFNCIRVYMTATSWSICESLYHSEQNVWQLYNIAFSTSIGRCVKYSYRHQHPKREFKHYTMKANYDRYRVHFFSGYGPHEFNSTGYKLQKLPDKKDLAVLMTSIPCPSQENKLVIFVRSRDDGEALEKAWRDNGIPAVFINRSSKSDPTDNRSFLSEIDDKDIHRNQVWKQLLRDEYFNESVLICTSVLDCGINIHDDAVKTIAIFADEPTTFIQMLGRKRFAAGSADTIDVWINVPTAKRFSDSIANRMLELEMATKLDYIRKHQNVHGIRHNSEGVFFSLAVNRGHIEGYKSNIVESISITQHTKLLESDYQYQFGENFMSFYYQLFSNYTRLGDKRLFCFDSFGHVFVDDYVRWIVAEQESYYKRLAENIDYKKMVLSWMGKDLEAEQERAAKLQELAAYLESHCEIPIREDERGIVRAMVVQAGLVCLQDNSFLQGWEKMMPKRINPILDSLNLGYVIERPDSSREKRWFVSKIENT